MIRIFCASKHGTTGALCAQCSRLRDYAVKRLERCKYGEDKPTCEKCTIHCYAAEQKEKIKEVMRFAGPRMLLRHPLLAIRHLLKNRKEAKV